MSEGVSREFKEVEGRIAEVSDRMYKQMLEIKDVLSDMELAKISETNSSLEASIEAPASNYIDISASNSSTDDEPPSLDSMFAGIRETWDELVKAIRYRLGDPEYFDARQIGTMASKLADGRRSYPISSSQVELIQQLYSQYKRFVRLQSRKDEWLSRDVYETFVRAVKEITQSIRSEGTL